MKKTIVVMVFAVAGLFITACGNKEDKEAGTEETAHSHKAGEEHHLAYQCPMDCEKGKTYTEKGTCPVCKMELIEAKADSHEGHDHSKESHEGHQH